MALQQVERRFMGDPPSLQIDHRVDQLEFGSIFTEIAAESDFAHFLPVKAMAADEHDDFARLACRPGDDPSGGAPGLAVVQPDIAFPYPRRCVRQQRKDRDAFFLQFGDRCGDCRMFDRNHRNRLAPRRQAFQFRGDFGRGLRFQEFDLGDPTKALRRVRRMVEFLGEALIEGLIGPLEQEAKPILRQVLLQPLLDQADGMIADGAGRLIDAPRCLLAHRQPAVQHAVHRRDADARRPGKIRNCRPSRQRLLLHAGNSSRHDATDDRF